MSSRGARHLGGIVGSSTHALHVGVGSGAEVVGLSVCADGLVSVAVICRSRASSRSVLQIGRASDDGASAELGSIASVGRRSA